MKIGTFNLKDLFGEGPFDFYGKEVLLTPEFIQQRVDSLSATIRDLDADLLFVHEIASEEVLERIARQTGISYKMFSAKPDRRGMRNALLYKSADIVCSSASSLGHLPVFVEGDEDVYGNRLDPSFVRDFIQVTDTFDGNPLYLIGVHLKSSVSIPKRDAEGNYLSITTQLEAADGHIRSRLYQFSQARRLRELVDALFTQDPEVQIVVLGDFNVPENDDTLRIIKGKLKDATGILTNVCEEIPEERRFSFVRGGRKRLLDHILVSENLQKRFQSVTVLNDALRDQALEKEQALVVESDHAPVLMEIKSAS